MANYPEWLMQYKTKGIYVKRTKEGYALYRGHSERVEGKNYPVFKCDEYLGIATEKDGLITPKPSVRPGVKVRRFGLYAVCKPICAVLLRSPRRKGLDAELLYAHSLLRVEGVDTPEGFAGSWMSEVYPDLDINRSLTVMETGIVERITKQIRAKLRSKFGEEEWAQIAGMASNVYAVHVNGQWVMSTLPEELNEALVAKGITIAIPYNRNTK